MKTLPLRFLYGEAATRGRTDVLSVDGVFGAGPNLSHWPGHRTPARYRHELSTGSALLLARDPDRAAFLKGVVAVANNHYDTDGLCALFAVLKPSEALAHQDLLLAAARTGDFEEAPHVDAVKADEIVSALPAHRASPIAFAVRGLPRERAEEFAYRYLLERLPGAFVDPSPYEPLWRDGVRAFEADIAAAAAGRIVVERDDALALAVVRVAEGPEPTARGATTLAAPYARILVVRPTVDGTHYRFRHTARSWFDLPEPGPPRFDLAPVAEALAARETSAAGTWLAGDVGAPTAELLFGVPRDAAGGAMDALGDTRPSGLPERVVLDALAAAARGQLFNGG